MSTSEEKDRYDNLTEQDKKLLLDHDYDGIQEYDYPLPSWWVGTFILTIFIGIPYLAYYNFLGGPSQQQTLDKEMAVIRAVRAEQAKKNAIFRLDDYKKLASSSKGKKMGAMVFEDNCVACHEVGGKGDIGPNLTDSYWLNIKEVTPESLYKVVKVGVEDNGMPAWGEEISNDEIMSVVGHLMNEVVGKNLPGKEVQGDKVE